MYFGKDNKGKWFVQFSYVDWTGKRIRTTKRGFKTKKEAQEYYTNFMSTKSGELNMLFSDFVDIYKADIVPGLSNGEDRQKRDNGKNDRQKHCHRWDDSSH